MNLNKNNNQQPENKSIFDYVVDNSMYVNKNKCSDFTAPFLTYIPSGIPNMNIDMENELKGMNRQISKCTESKYQAPKQNNVLNPNNNLECTNEYKILPRDYINRI